jgi:hypothetical protein
VMRLSITAKHHICLAAPGKLSNEGRMVFNHGIAVGGIIAGDMEH